MAVTNRDSKVQSFKPRWPELRMLSPERVRFTYDRPTDTLFVDLYGEARAAASVPLERGDWDYLFVRVDPETDAVVGFQIEHFLSYAIEQHPELISALDLAALVDIDRDELERVAPVRSRRLRRGDQAAVLEDLLRLSA